MTLFFGAAGVAIVAAAMIVALLRRELRAPRAAMRFDTASERATALGCPASLIALAAVLAAFVGLAFGW